MAKGDSTGNTQKTTARELPPNLLVDSTLPDGTLTRCRDVIAFLADAVPAMMRNKGEILTQEQTGEGIAYILDGVKEAIEFEMRRSTVKAEG